MSCFALAHEFEKKGYKVIFTGNSPNLQNLVKQNDFEYVEMAYQTEDVVPNLKYFFSFFILSILSKSFLFKRYREFYANIIEVKRLMSLTKADYVFIDAHLYQYYFYFSREKCKVFLLNTKLLTSQKGNNPPLSTDYLPKTNLISRITNELLWIKVIMQHKFQSAKMKFMFLGKDDEFFTKRFCIKNNIPYETIINRRNVFYYGIKNVKRILLASEFLDLFASKDENHNYYICLEYKRKEDDMLNNSNYIALKNEISEIKNRKIILCSFGTVINEKDKAKIDFLNRLNIAVKDENYLLIVVSKNPNIISNRNTNVRVVPSIPQLDLLQSCDLMIHHAGLNTIKECLQFQVPMLIYTPKEKSFDRVGNASRIQFNGLGLVGNIYTDSPIKIKENIEKAMLIKMPKQNYEQEYSKLNKFIDENIANSLNN